MATAVAVASGASGLLTRTSEAAHARLVVEMTSSPTNGEVNLVQVARGNFRSLTGRWTEKAYAVNPQDGTGEQWRAGSPRTPDTLNVDSGALVFNQSDPTLVTHAALSYPQADNTSRYLRLRWRIGKGVVTASVVNRVVPINYELYVYSTRPAVKTNNGVRLSDRPTIELWSSNDGYTMVFQR